MPLGRLVSSPKSTGCLQNGHGARFVGGFVRHARVMHLRQKLWLRPSARSLRPEADASTGRPTAAVGGAAASGSGVVLLESATTAEWPCFAMASGVGARACPPD